VESRIEKRAAGATKPDEATVKGKIVEYSWWMKKQGYAECTITTRTRLLRLLTKRGANLFDPESIKGVIAQQPWKDGSKAQAVAAYATFIEMMGWIWKPPKYKQNERLPFIPLEAEIDQLIAGCSKKIGTFLQTLKETAARFGEAWLLKWINVDSNHNTITINAPEKNSKPRMIKVSSKLIAMINKLPKKSEMIFATTNIRNFRTRYCQQRRRITEKLQNPRILEITFHTLRHWKATMEYQRTRDILYVKKLLGHKKIDNTLIYTQLVNFESDEYHVRTAKTLEEACELAEAGFEYFTTMEEAQIFRKRK